MQFPDRCKALDQFYDYFPNKIDNEVPEGGCWILVVNPPNTEYSVPPFSFWFAEPWPMESSRGPAPKRVKIITQQGELGLFPSEYRLIREPEEYYEFIGKEITIHFFGNGDAAGVPKDKLFYLRSRGISNADALAMLIRNIKGHCILWLECSKEIQDAFVR